MIPVVATAEPHDPGPKVDRRTTRPVGWKEARWSLVHAPGSVTPVFGATVGACAEAGETLLRAAVQAGLGRNTKVHVVSDGATWMADQVQVQCGLQGELLVDFYHVCDNLARPATRSRAPTSGPGWRNRKIVSNKTGCRT
jgi:hypothetical protein